MTTLMDVYLRVPTGEDPRSWHLLAAGVSEDHAQTVKTRSLWPVDTRESSCAACAADQPTETEPSASPAATKLTPATSYAAWMQLPPSGGKVPWSRIADEITPDEAHVFRTGTGRPVSVQPSATAATEA